VRGIVRSTTSPPRDLQRTDGQWTRAKGFDTLLPDRAGGAAPGDLTAIEVVTG
jgi:hypothetical protein